VAACGPSNHPGDDSGDDNTPVVDGGGSIDSPFVDVDAFVPPVPDAGNQYVDAGGGGGDGGCVGSTCQNPVADGCGAVEICDNGSDDNCNLMVDEGCPCTQGDVQPCFLGPPGYRGVGACADGMQTCQGQTEFTQWGPCVGGIKPSAEACDSLDNDCNGCVDDDPMCCTVELACPSSMPDGQPFQDYVIDGTQFFAGPVMSWGWTVTGGPCDVLLAPNVSYTLAGQNTSTLTFRPTLSGDYTVRVTMVLPDGTVYECEFIVHIGGPGLRVEACWDTDGVADIDLHVHKPDDTSPWFTTDGSTNSAKVNPADCYYFNCRATNYFCPIPGLCGDQANWGYAASPLSACVGGPEGATWQLVGSCANPRLDIDNIATVGKPENINIDRPVDGKTYRVMVHYYDGSVATHPLVNVYCDGHLQATYGQAPDLVSGFNVGGQFAAGTMWRVVDVTTHVNAMGVTTGCDLTALHPPGMATGYHVTNNSTAY
jgi:hypothetical protein